MVKSGFQEKILSFIRDKGLFCSGSRVVVGVSGGQDSVALFHLLYQFRHDLGIKLIVAHYNHAFRKGADRDQAFVRALAGKSGVPFVTEKNDVGLPLDGSIEEFARDRRYSFFKKVVRFQKADCVAVAHTEDDLAETVLMRILRGTGLSGLRAMLPKREINGMAVIRPLLIASRAEVENYIRKNRLKFVQDPSNRSLDYFRNRIRHRIMPLLEKTTGRNIRTHLAGLASIAAFDYDFIEEQTSAFFKVVARKRSGKVLLSLKKLAFLHPALRRSLIRMAIAKVNRDLNAFSQDHILAIERMILCDNTANRVDLPKNIRAEKIGKYLVLFQKRRQQTLE